MVRILHEITKEQLINFQKNSPSNHLIIIKFTADWCGPCKIIKKDCLNLIDKLCDNIGYCEINIDEYIELYAYFKQKKMIKGIPALLAFKAGKENLEHWYIPDDSIVGADKDGLYKFFNRCQNYANN
tara:strand:+ start:146 stop:526 length:381 start_codon:yes stop_codon:yes gene_type:complete